MTDGQLNTTHIEISDTTSNSLRYGSDTALDALGNNIIPSMDHSYRLSDNYYNAQSLLNPTDYILQHNVETSEYIFGTQSVLVDVTARPSDYLTQSGLLIDNICFQSFLIACFAGICLLVYFYKDQIASIFNIFRGQFYVEKLLDEQNRLFDIFVNLAVTILIILISIASVKYLDIFYGPLIIAIMPDWSILLLVPLSCIIYSFVIFFQFGLLSAVGAMTNNNEFTSNLIRLKMLIMGTGAITLSPIILLFAMSYGKQTEILGCIVVIIVSIIVFFLLIKSYLFFIDRKVSIFYWFLYLCAVEIFPISFFIILLSKIV